MLILSRREGEAILLDGGIKIVVIACDRRGVRIGIEAPPEVSILRGEIVAQVEAATRHATASPAAAALLGGAGGHRPTPVAPAPAPAP